MKTFLLFTLAFFSFISLKSFAQDGASETPKIKEIKTYISSLKTGGDKKMKVSTSNSQFIENLVFGVQSSIYFNTGIEKIYGDKPVKLFTDISSLTVIPSSDSSKDDIEIVVIKLNNTADLYSKIDLTKFSKFSSLKYIYIISSINTSEQNIVNMFINYKNQYSIFYKIEIAE